MSGNSLFPLIGPLRGPAHLPVVGIVQSQLDDTPGGSRPRVSQPGGARLPRRRSSWTRILWSMFGRPPSPVTF